MDDVAIELVEAKLVKVLPDIFSPMTVFTMPPNLVGRMAGESDEKLRRREQLEKQLDVLSKGSDFCKRFVGMKLAGEAPWHGSWFSSDERGANIAADVIVGGERRPVSGDEPTSEDKVVSEGEPLSADELLSEGAPASEVNTIPPHDSSELGERVASPEFAYHWSDQPPSPVDEELLMPSPRFY